MTAKLLITGLMEKNFTKLLSFSLFAAPAFVLTVNHGLILSTLVILLLSVLVLLSRFAMYQSLSKKEKIFIGSLLLLPMVIALDVVLRGLNLRYLDFYLRFFLVVPIFFALRRVKVNLSPLFWGIVVGSMGAGLFALYQYYFLQTHLFKDSTSLGYMIKINFGNISLLLAMMSLAGLILLKEMRFKKTCFLIILLAFTLGITGSIISGSRGGWLAIPFFASLFMLCFPGKLKSKIFSSIILMLGLFVIYSANISVKSRIDLAYNNTEAYFASDKQTVTKTSVGSRLELWKAGWMIASEHPYLGIGSGQFQQALKEKIAAGDIKPVELYGHVHNELLEILLSTGAIGLIAVIILYAGTSYYFYRTFMSSKSNKISYLSLLGMMLVGAYFIFGLTNYSFAHHVMVLFFAIMLTIFAGMISSIENKILT